MKNKLDTVSFQNKLENQRNKILGDLKKYNKFPDYGNSIEDNAEEMEEFSEGVGFSKQLNRHLKEINEALEKIKNGKYGVCAKCSKPIDPARLKSYPASLYCIEDEKKIRRSVN